MAIFNSYFNKLPEGTSAAMVLMGDVSKPILLWGDEHPFTIFFCSLGYQGFDSWRLTSAACVLTFQLNLLSRHVHASVSATRAFCRNAGRTKKQLNGAFLSDETYVCL